MGYELLGSVKAAVARKCHEEAVLRAMAACHHDVPEPYLLSVLTAGRIAPEKEILDAEHAQ